MLMHCPDVTLFWQKWTLYAWINCFATVFAATMHVVSFMWSWSQSHVLLVLPPCAVLIPSKVVLHTPCPLIPSPLQLPNWPKRGGVSDNWGFKGGSHAPKEQHLVGTGNSRGMSLTNMYNALFLCSALFLCNAKYPKVSYRPQNMVQLPCFPLVVFLYHGQLGTHMLASGTRVQFVHAILTTALKGTYKSGEFMLSVNQSDKWTIKDTQYSAWFRLVVTAGAFLFLKTN